ncbi:MAG TPA: TetR/AcrR family transcriptional regulator [Acidimicrobiales bacterium]|nr:TetR/AcrR family transcriptional regulator [Acidimicrobiales bacterium]
MSSLVSDSRAEGVTATDGGRDTAAAPEATRRRLSARQADTVERLTVAAVDGLREHSYDGLSVRNVAARAGVAPATAYTYFSSKDHLVAEVYWRRVQSLPTGIPDTSRTPAQRVAATLSELALIVADEPDLAAATTVALLSAEPDVKVLRDRIGATWHDRIVTALGDDARDDTVTVLDLAVSGALLQTGMGHLSYADLPDLLTQVATTVLEASQ